MQLTSARIERITSAFIECLSTPMPMVMTDSGHVQYLELGSFV